ncbi:MAG: nucleotidyltransferase family protein [Marinilabiliaceae bacterium]|nr:nucleotidyltransferase family protein [Marinilabiliaceae bacterium]
MEKQYKNILLHSEKGYEALRRLDDVINNHTIFIVNDEESLIGTITDGDMRRGLLNGLSLEQPVLDFCFKDYVYINNSTDVYQIKEFRKKGVKTLPRLDDKKRIVEIYNLDELKTLLPIHAVLMAGGRGERLRPLTDDIPKPLLSIGDKSIIERNIDRLIRYGIESITITVRYLKEKIIDRIGDGSKWGIKINYIEEDKPLGTIGCLSLIDTFSEDTVLLMNSDLLTNIDFEDFYLEFLESNAEMSVASIPYSVSIPYAILELEDNKVVDFKEKPKNTYYANAGIYLMKREVLNEIPRNEFFNATDLMEIVMKRKGLIHSPITGLWIDIGKPDDYKKALELVKHLNDRE